MESVGYRKPDDRYVPRPLQWTGEGLPPVGLVAEVLFNSHPPEYFSCKVLAHDEGRAVYRFTSGPRKGEYGSDLPNFENGNPMTIFRPIRTPEQIAAEERRACIDEMKNVFDSNFEGCRRDGLEALYDAGYRKQPTDQ